MKSLNYPMLKKTLLIISGIFIISTLNSCFSGYWAAYDSTVPKKMNIDIVKPAKINLPAQIRKVVIVNNSIIKNKERYENSTQTQRVYEKFYLDSLASEAAVDSLKKDLINSRRFDLVKTENVHFSGADSTQINILLKKLCLSHNADAILILDVFEMSLNFDAYSEPECSTSDNRKSQISHAYIKTKIKTQWRILNPDKNKVVDFVRHTKSYEWEDQQSNSIKDLVKLSNRKQFALLGAKRVSKKYASRIAPVWQPDVRLYFDTGNDALKKAAQMAKNQDWDKAAAIWDKQAKNPDKKIARRAMYNRALAYEMKGELEKAYKQAQKTFERFGFYEAKLYARILKRRVEDQKKIQKQLGGK